MNPGEIKWKREGDAKEDPGILVRVHPNKNCRNCLGRGVVMRFFQQERRLVKALCGCVRIEFPE